MLDMLVAFRGFCKAEGLRYSLCGGTLLGAVRHKGFIPWDDDVDVCMPRPDYERLLGLAGAFVDETGYLLSGCFGVSCDKAAFLKMLDPRIAVDAKSEEHPESWLWIDVFPIDALPDDEASAESLYRRAKFLRLLMSIPATKQGCGRNAARRLVGDVARPLLRATNACQSFSGRLRALAAAIPWGSTGHAGSIAWGLYGMREWFPLRQFEECSTVLFEGEEFSAMADWDSYLASIYGDYMQLPPEDKRVAHDVMAWWVDGDGGNE